MEVQQLTVGQLQTNCYLVIDHKTRDTLIIDPGDDGDYILRKISDMNLIPKLIAVTHGHFDHVLAVTELKLAFDVPFWMHKADLPILKSVQKTTKYFTGSQTDPPSLPDKFIKEGEKIIFGHLNLKVIATPGHTPGGVSFYGEKVLFSGDTIFADGVGRTDFSYSSKNELKKSISKLIMLPSSTIVYPGHGPSTTLGEVSKGQPAFW
jgi:glyoxylase-like metal-dependent hydrolase (beta-lactamase superfamily II)